VHDAPAQYFTKKQTGQGPIHAESVATAQARIVADRLERNTMSESKVSNVASFVTRLNPSTMLDATAIGNSQISIAEAGRLAFIAGQTATRTDGGPLPQDLASQARMVATRLAAALHELGASARDVVAFHMYVVNGTPDRFEEAWSPLQEMLMGEMPSGTAIGVQALWTPELQIEVEMTVRVP
jgi:enamine deaminase RidA (YjgF/YER057c/UK114 family)